MIEKIQRQAAPELVAAVASLQAQEQAAPPPLGKDELKRAPHF